MITVQPNEKIIVGYAYPTWYMGRVTTEEANSQGVQYLQRIKGVRHLYVVIDREDGRRYIASDVNLDTQTYADLVGKFKTALDANVTLFLQHPENSVTSEDMFAFIENAEDDYWLFKETLQGKGYSYQFCVWNNTAGTFQLTAIDVEQKLHGKRYISGGT